MTTFSISGVKSSGPTTRELYHAQSKQSVAACGLENPPDTLELNVPSTTSEGLLPCGIIHL